MKETCMKNLVMRWNFGFTHRDLRIQCLLPTECELF